MDKWGLAKSLHGYINPHLKQCLSSGWMRLLQVVAHREREMIPGILFALFGVVSIVGECEEAAFRAKA